MATCPLETITSPEPSGAPVSNPTFLEMVAYYPRLSADAKVALVRELFGDPLRVVAFNSAPLAWRHNTIPKMAQVIYEERTFSGLPILADALEDAGCDNAELLDHCRQPGGHMRGCWALDLLMGKS
jgi:hypothetical protein